MKARKLGTLLTFITLFGSLGSCKYIPQDIADALNGMSYYEACQKIGKIRLTSELKSYDNKDFSGETNGSRTTSFVYEYLGKTDGLIPILSIEYIQSFEGRFVEDGVTGSVEIIGYDSQKDTYLIDITQTKDGEEVKKDTQEKGNGYYSTLEEEVFGDDDTHQNGLYYGQFLQTLAGNFYDMMSYDEESGILTYDPPASGKYVEHPENFADLIYKVDSLGMLVYSFGKYYDIAENSYFTEEINVSYEKR